MNRKTYISQNELTPEMTGNAYRENVRRRKKQEDLRRAALFGSTTPDNLKIEGGGLMPQEFLAPSSQRQREYVILTTPVDFPEIGRAVDTNGQWARIPDERRKWPHELLTFSSAKAAGKFVKQRIARYDELRDSVRPTETAAYNRHIGEQNHCVDFLHAVVLQI